MKTSILIIDYGSQFTQLIARRVREIGVYSIVLGGNNLDDNLFDYIKNNNIKGIILSGSYDSTYKENATNISHKILNIGIPILGICYGMQSIVHQLGGKVVSSKHREFGCTKICIYNSKLLNNLSGIEYTEGNSQLEVLMSHGDKVTEIPEGFKVIASSKSCSIAGIEDAKRNIYGLQFHPEVTHTTSGKEIISRFVNDICGCSKDWSMHNFLDEKINSIKDQIANDNVILGLSGGIDSSVVALLLHKAIGSKLTCIFVDHGMLRLNEAQDVIENFSKLGIKVIYVNASEQFMNKLSGVYDPEEKRLIIGKEFIEIFQEQASKIENVKWLAQGTIYSDIIESAKNSNNCSAPIKSHHNVGGLPSNMNLKLIEPIKDLFKDEVKKLGVILDLPNSILDRHPFPGPGLAIRIIGEIKEKFIRSLQEADNIFIEELKYYKLNKESNWYNNISQAFAIFLPIKTVGVMGDSRTYEYVIALRAVQTSDFMTAKWAKIPYDLLEKISTRIINEVKMVNRVVYDISSKPPATIEWE